MATSNSGKSSPTVSNKTADTILQQMEVLADSIPRMVSNYKKLGKAKHTASSAEGRLKALQDCWRQYEHLHLKLLDAVPAQAKSLLPFFTNDTFILTEESYWAAADFFVEVIDSCKSATSVASCPSQASPVEAQKTIAHLPRIQLPKFSGSYLEWQSFRELFNSLVISNRALDNVQRLHYLKTSVEGQAASLTAHIPLTDANFETAWNALKERYDNKRAIIGALLHNFMSLPPMTSESITDLTRIRDKTRESIEVLRSMGRPVEHWDDVIVYVVTHKLDRLTIKEWETSRGASNEPPLYSALDQFLVTRHARRGNLPRISPPKEAKVGI